MSKLTLCLAVFGLLALRLAAGATAEKTAPALAPPDTDWSKAGTTTVLLSNFAFSPDHLSLRVGVPVHLVLVNVGSGKHDFSAPEFFSTAMYRPDSTVPRKGSIALAKSETKDLYLLPTKAGHYELECTEFLHSLFGMTGAIEVTGGGS